MNIEQAQARIKELEDTLEALSKNGPYPEQGCSDGNCIVQRPTGMHTNGGCQHLKLYGESEHDKVLLKQVTRALQWIRQTAGEALKCKSCRGAKVQWATGWPQGRYGMNTCQTCKGSGKHTIIDMMPSSSDGASLQKK